MSLVGLQEIIADNRADLVSAGIRGIDLDYLLDPRVEHKPCLEAFQKLVDGPLMRWREVLANTTLEALEFLKLTEPKHQKVVAAHEARKNIKNFFKGYVLSFYKDMERKVNEEREAARAAKKAANEQQ